MSRSRMNRRKFIKQATGAAGAGLIASAGMPLTGTAQSTDGAEAAGSITDIAGIKVGHFTDTRRPTGCTVVIAEAGAVGGVERAGARVRNEFRSA